MMGNRPVCLRSPVPKPIQKQCRARRLPMVLQSAHPPGPSVPSLSGPLCPFVPLSLPFRPCLSGPLCPFVPLSLPFRPCLSAPLCPFLLPSLPFSSLPSSHRVKSPNPPVEMCKSPQLPCLQSSVLWKNSSENTLPVGRFTLQISHTGNKVRKKALRGEISPRGFV